MNIPAVLLAAGRGTRLQPLTDTLPKCLVPIAGRPLLDYWLEMCQTAGFSPIIVNLHYLSEQVAAHVAASPYGRGVTLAYERILLGTGGTLLRHADALRGSSFFVAHADNVSLFSMKDFWAAHCGRPADCLMTMMLFKSAEPWNCGIVSLDERGVVQAFYEKDPTVREGLANGAVYFMEPEVLSLLDDCAAPAPDISLDVMPRCMGRIATFRNDIYHRDIGTPESYAAAQKDFPSAGRLRFDAS